MGASPAGSGPRSAGSPNEFYGMGRPGDKLRRGRRSVRRSVGVKHVDVDRPESALVVAAGPDEHAAALARVAPYYGLGGDCQGHKADLPRAVGADPDEGPADKGEPAASRVVGGVQLLRHKPLVLTVAVKSDQAADFRRFSLGWGGDFNAADGPAPVSALLEDTLDMDGRPALLVVEDDDALGDDLTAIGHGLHPGQRALLERARPRVDLRLRCDGELLATDDQVVREGLCADVVLNGALVGQ